MAGRSAKKNHDNFEKIKREMTEKKQKAKTQKNPEKAKVSTENSDLKTRSNKANTVKKKNKRIETVAENIDKGRIDYKKGKELKEDIAGKMQQDEKKNTADTGKIELVVFRVGEEEFALRLLNIKEIIRVPPMTKVPNVPHYVNGLCSLRGELLPVLDSRKLFGMPEQEFGESSRIIVADIHGKKVGLLTDRVSEVISIEETEVREPPASIKGIDGEIINGILILNDGKRVVMILDAEKIIKAGDIDAVENAQHAPVINLSDAEMKEEEEQIVIFNIGMGEYAFNINYVKEIIRLPDIIKVPNTADYIDGVFSIRNQLLAAINPGSLLGMGLKPSDEHSRVVIINNGSLSYGVIVDKVSHVVRVQKELFKESGQDANYIGTEFVKGIYNLNNGKRLVMVLEPQKLISLEELKGVLEADHSKTVNDISLYAGESDNHLEYVVFKLDEEEYGIGINNVLEINRIGEITRFPGAPSFIDGMVDLRGDVIPILNLRRLFDLRDSDSCNASKFLVVEFEKKKIGFMIDSVSEVLRVSKTCLEEAPEVFKGNEQDSYIEKIAKLNDGKRVVLILYLSTMLSFM